MFQNAAKTSNKGVEVALNYNIVRSKDLDLNFGITYNYNVNKVEEVPADAAHDAGEVRQLVLGGFLEDADGHLVDGADGIPGSELVLDAGRHDDDAHLREFGELEFGQVTHGRPVSGELGGNGSGQNW